MINSFKLLLFNKSFCVELCIFWNMAYTFAIDGILAQHRFAYQALIYQLTAKQKQVLTAIALEGKPSSLMSQEFLQKYHLGASTVQGAVKTLLDRDFITQDDGGISVMRQVFGAEFKGIKKEANV